MKEIGFANDVTKGKNIDGVGQRARAPGAQQSFRDSFRSHFCNLHVELYWNTIR